MTIRLTLLCQGASAATRRTAFPADEGLDAKGRAQVEVMRPKIPNGAQVWASPSRAAIETAEIIGVAAEADAVLRDLDHGHWSGLALEAVQASDPEALSRWLRDPTVAPPGGESLATLAARVAEWLDGLRAQDSDRVRNIVVIADAGVIRAAIVHALGAPLSAMLRIDVAPLSRTMLSGSGSGWRLQRLEPPTKPA